MLWAFFYWTHCDYCKLTPKKFQYSYIRVAITSLATAMISHNIYPSIHCLCALQSIMF